MRFPRYNDYRPSGTSWFPDVPSHWDVRALRTFGKLLKGGGGSKEDVSDEGVPCVRYGDIYMEHDFHITSARTRISTELSENYTPILFGDALFAASGEKMEEIGKSAVNLIRERAFCGGDVIIFRPTERVHAEFLGYAADCRPAAAQKASMGRGTTIKHIYPDELRHLLLPMPPLNEQRTIATFLARETAAIDTLVAEQKRLLELLDEKRIAVVTHAVTKGLNPDVQLKDSGVQWLGAVPAHWAVLQSRRLFGVRSEPALPTDVQLTASQKYGVLPQSEYIEREGRRVVEVIKGVESLLHVEPNDFIISMRSFQGGLEWCQLRGSTSFHYVMVVPRSLDRVHPPYFARLFKSSTYIQALRSTTDLIRDGQEIRYSHFVQVPLPAVPLSEQKEIADFIDREVAAIDALSAQASRAIDLLKERRIALITAAVTGQIDVRDAARTAA